MDREKFIKQYTEPFRYKDTGREVSWSSLKDRIMDAYEKRGLLSAGLEGLQGVSEPFDSVMGAPYRRLAMSLAEGKGLSSLKDAYNQVGMDPQTAPTGADVAEKVFPDESQVIPRTFMATATDVSDVGSLLGAGALMKKAFTSGKARLPFSAGTEVKTGAQELLDQIDTVEKQKLLRETNPEGYQKYLQALDEVQGPQAVREKAMGFSPEDWYHGGPEGIESFKTNSKGANKYLEGVYAAQYPGDAERYADIVSHRGKSTGQKGKVYKIKIPENRLNLDNFQDVDKAIAAMGYEVPEYKNKFKYNPEMDSLTKMRLAIEKSGVKPSKVDSVLKAKLEEAGFRGVQTVNDQVASVFNPKHIRSIDAAFDTRFADSPDLLAGALPAFGVQDLLNYKEDEKKKKVFYR